MVHDHTLAGPVYAQGFTNLPVVTTNHGPFESELGDYYRAIASRVPVIAISRHQASTAMRTPIAAVIHHGVDVARFPVGDGAGGYAVFLGRMGPDKDCTPPSPWRAAPACRCASPARCTSQPNWPTSAR